MTLLAVAHLVLVFLILLLMPSISQKFMLLKNGVYLATKKFGFRNNFNYLFQADTYTNQTTVLSPTYNDLSYLVTSKIFAETKVRFDCDIQVYNFDLLLQRNDFSRRN
ncbi:MAG: hypothetical protein LBE12_19820 [Planctomycetaceae bacterium]|nr:hypothetical protein [Planctomycetaceae bacterium]